MIPSPELDDRSFDDIVEEAIRLIPQYCPEWTNFNRADPGITLLELFAWMQEMVLYRLNQVPEKNYIAFLNLLGIRLQPPSPARALVTFEISEKTDQVRIPSGTRLQTKPSDDKPALLFETSRDLLALTTILERCVSQAQQGYEDHTQLAQGASGSFEVFGGERSIERFLYLGDPRFEAFGDDAILILRFEGQSPGDREFHELLEWEYWDGNRWRGLVPAAIDLERNSVAFHGPGRFESTEVDEAENYWIRGRLFEVPNGPEETLLDTISAHLEILGEGVPPDHALANAEGDFHQTLDIDKNFLPFGKAPKVDSTFYLGSTEVLGQPDSRIRIDVELSDQTVADRPEPTDDLVLRWEYYNGKRWKLLARVVGGEVDGGTHGFVDGTSGFTLSGSIIFDRPDDLAEAVVSGMKSRWVRCRVQNGGFGVPGSYELDADTWVWRDDRPLRPPHLKRVAFRFEEVPHAVAACVTYNDFVYQDHSEVAAVEYKPFQVFEAVAEESPTFYLGWSNPFPQDSVSLYFNVVGSEGRGGRAALAAFDDRSEGIADSHIAWEYWNGKSWRPLAPDDGTYGFTQSGFLSFVGPKDQRRDRRFGDNLYWLRARLEMGGYEDPPRVDAILTNAVYCENVTTYGDTPLGSSNGATNQAFRIPRAPILDGETLVVHEADKPHPAVIADLRERLGERAVIDGENGGAWVRWTPVDSFYDQSPTDRVYVKNITTGEVRFGDGVRGMIPPKGNKNVRAARYRTGGGSVGNVPANTIVSCKQNLSYVVSVTNPYPASGGCDMEDVEQAKLRAPHVLKARNRAVTLDDFEWLAREASNSVARVKCLPSTPREGQIAVVIVPRMTSSSDLSERPVPTTELLKTVRDHLSERKLVGTVLHVVRPSYAEMSVDVTFARAHGGSMDRIQRAIERSLRRFLHPLVGGRAGGGWDFGRAVLKIDLYQVIEDIEGVDYVDKIRIFDEDSGRDVEQLKLGDDQLVHLVNVNVVERSHDRIL